MESKSHFIFLSLAAVLAALPACGRELAPTDPDPSAPGDLVVSNLPRDLNPLVSAEASQTLVRDNAAFGLDLLEVLRREEPKNLFFSPHSISIALGMTYGGARSSTALEMEDALHFTLGQEGLHPAFNALDLKLTGYANDDFELSILNQLWGRIGEVFVPEFLDLLALDYGAGLRLMDFRNAPEQSRIAINDWVAAVTMQRVKDLLPRGLITGDTALVLTNAIYFKAQWLNGFVKELTGSESFYTAAGNVAMVDMMHLNGELAYLAGEGFAAVELPYDESSTSMLVVVPELGNFEYFASSFDSAGLAEIIEGLSQAQVSLSFPKIEITSGMSVKQALEALGMEIPFTGAADFTGMRAAGGLAIGDVIHKGFVKVDEDGTEAAAATAVVMVDTGEPPASVSLTVDRPFLFFVRDNATGAVLFIGQVLDPTAT